MSADKRTEGSATLRLAPATLAIALAAAVCACQPKAPPRIVAPPAADEPSRGDIWAKVANPADRARISQVAVAWAAGLGEARKAGFRSAIGEEGPLLDPRAAQARPAPTPGSYRCRLVTLGREGKRGPALEKFKPFFCYVGIEGALFTIVKQTGSERPAGRLWEDDVATRLIFLGSVALGNEEEVRAYGDDPKRDVAGVFERIAPFRWRLVIPYPHGGAKLDVIEFTPVADQPEG
jgi:hypothetical protein